MTTLQYRAVSARQSKHHQVLCFAASAREILQFSEIERVGRDSAGVLRGFQRPQIASHIRDIRDYLAREDAVLPNTLVVAFINGVSISPNDDGTVDFRIEVGESKPGLVVDGQQRLTAISGLPDKEFQVFVSALICRDYEELRQQFVLINNTRPLPKALIYELLPSTPGLPEQFTAKTFAAKVVEVLNYDENYQALHGMIKLHTNPSGVISDTAMRKIISNSASDGAIREFLNDPDYVVQAAALVDRFFDAVGKVFPDAWKGHKPNTSRLVHGAGIVAMGYVMEFLCSKTGSNSSETFVEGLRLLAKPGLTAWTSGQWPLSDVDRRPWNKIQNVPQDIMALASYLVRELKVGFSPC